MAGQPAANWRDEFTQNKRETIISALVDRLRKTPTLAQLTDDTLRNQIIPHEKRIFETVDNRSAYFQCLAQIASSLNTGEQQQRVMVQPGGPSTGAMPSAIPATVMGAMPAGVVMPQQQPPQIPPGMVPGGMHVQGIPRQHAVPAGAAAAAIAAAGIPKPGVAYPVGVVGQPQIPKVKTQPGVPGPMGLPNIPGAGMPIATGTPPQQPITTPSPPPLHQQQQPHVDHTHAPQQQQQQQQQTQQAQGVAQPQIAFHDDVYWAKIESMKKYIDVVNRILDHCARKIQNIPADQQQQRQKFETTRSRYQTVKLLLEEDRAKPKYKPSLKTLEIFNRIEKEIREYQNKDKQPTQHQAQQQKEHKPNAFLERISALEKGDVPPTVKSNLSSMLTAFKQVADYDFEADFPPAKEPEVEKKTAIASPASTATSPETAASAAAPSPAAPTPEQVREEQKAPSTATTLTPSTVTETDKQRKRTRDKDEALPSVRSVPKIVRTLHSHVHQHSFGGTHMKRESASGMQSPATQAERQALVQRQPDNEIFASASLDKLRAEAKRINDSFFVKQKNAGGLVYVFQTASATTSPARKIHVQLYPKSNSLSSFYLASPHFFNVQQYIYVKDTSLDQQTTEKKTEEEGQEEEKKDARGVPGSTSPAPPKTDDEDAWKLVGDVIFENNSTLGLTDTVNRFKQYVEGLRLLENELNSRPWFASATTATTTATTPTGTSAASTTSQNGGSAKSPSTTDLPVPFIKSDNAEIGTINKMIDKIQIVLMIDRDNVDENIVCCRIDSVACIPDLYIHVPISYPKVSPTFVFDAAPYEELNVAFHDAKLKFNERVLAQPQPLRVTFILETWFYALQATLQHLR